jgi:hypothetical protein
MGNARSSVQARPHTMQITGVDQTLWPKNVPQLDLSMRQQNQSFSINNIQHLLQL